MKITFHGAAGEVTGSQHLIEAGGLRILLDCGLFQGRRSESRVKNSRLRHNPAELDLVILSHAHIDHCGNLPSLYRDGFRGPLYSTDATADVADLMLRDSVKIQQEDARYLNKRRGPDEPRVEPLYDDEDVRGIVGLMDPVHYGRWIQPHKDLRFRFSDAGHIIGSAITELEIQENGEVRRLVFTGDLGRRGLPLLNDPALVNGCDVLITECTYGNRVHPPAADLKAELARIVKEAARTGGKVVIPAFALGRTQQVVYFLNELANAGEIPKIPVFVDSPLSNRLTEVFRRHANLFDEEARKSLLTDRDVFGFHGLTYVATQQESMELNRKAGPLVVISASGMCESGRVLHHLKHAVEDPRNIIVMIGFQAENTLGRRLVERAPRIRILDRELDLNAKVETLNGLSGHADVHDFKWWFDHMAQTTGIGQAFLVHGEPAAAQALSTVLKDYCDEDPVIPALHQTIEV
jgi:metallo-beta-lactamase family protein